MLSPMIPTMSGDQVRFKTVQLQVSFAVSFQHRPMVERTRALRYDNCSSNHGWSGPSPLWLRIDITQTSAENKHCRDSG